MTSNTVHPDLGVQFRRGTAALLLAVLAACGGDGHDAAFSPGPGSPSGGNPPGDGSGPGGGMALQRADFRVNSTADGRQHGGEIVRLSDGGFVAVWVHPSAVRPGEVRIQRYDARAGALGVETMVTSSGTQPGVAALADGGFVVTWTDLPTPLTRRGHLQVFDAGGNPRGGVSTIADAPLKFVAHPVGVPGGGFVVAFTASAAGGIEYGALQLFSADGQAVNQPVTVNDDLADNLTHVLNIVASPLADGFAAAWDVSAPSGSRIMLGRFGIDGNPRAPFTTVDSDATEKRTPSLATLGGGQLVLGWAAFDAAPSGTTRTLQMTRLDAAGRPLGRQAVATGPLDRPFELDVAATADGGFVVASSTMVDAGQGANQQTVAVQRFDAAGAPLAEAEIIAQFAVPSLALGALGSLDAAGAGDGQFILSYGSFSPAADWDVRAAVR